MSATADRAATAARPPAPATRRRSTFVRDTLIVFRRALRLALRNPVWTILGLTQPILYLVLFGPLLEPLAKTLGARNAYQLFVPGLLVQLGMFGSMFVGFGLIGEWRDGVIEAERVTPAPRGALLLGRVLRDVLVLAVQGTVLSGVAYFFGLRAPLGGIVLGIVIVALLAMAFSSASYGTALALKSEDALAPLANGIALPALLLSGILLPMTLAPLWLRRLSDLNPLKHIVDGVRALFRGETTSSTAIWGMVLTVLLGAIGYLAGTRVFRRDNA